MKIVAVGDGAVGKTSLIIVHYQHVFPFEYIPTILDIEMSTIVRNKKNIQYQLWDTAGAEDYDRLRPLAYPETDVFFLCYAIDSRTSFENITAKWIIEVRHHMPTTPIILVGTKEDLRHQPNVVSVQEAEQVAKQIGAYAHILCSSLNSYNINLLLSTALDISYQK
ncbi:Rac/Rho-like_protein [Hexamita inflata]|uniref:Rac/Rho-like protein n=1 Tax=Hexamita inflata TaxID=28002 RepID=A0AA86V347_9EUKA|nr:Rac/Rho-like protein [Hexamita inflata]